jgi:hypothetical protein
MIDGKGRLLALWLCLTLMGGWMISVQADNTRYELVESNRSIMRVGPNQTLDQLVEHIYPGQKELWTQIKKKIREINPNSFNRYTGQLIVGQRLKLVTIKVIREVGIEHRLRSVGVVTELSGLVTATDRNGRTTSLKKGSDVYEGDRIRTGKAAHALVYMIDRAELHIKPDSSLRITEYLQKSGFERGSTSIIDLIKGGLRKVTGAIGNNPLSNYRFHAGVITIGVRGTDYVVKLCQENDCSQSAGRNDADSRLHLVVLDGLIVLQDEEGERGEMALGQYAIADNEQVVMVEEGKQPASGLLETTEQEMFDKLKPEEESSSIWPWLIGGALFGL